MPQPARLAVNAAERIIGIIDLGSNSVRLLIVRLFPDGSSTVLNQVKHMVRLGEGGFTHSRLSEESMTRTIAVLRGLAEMCAVYHVSETIAIATAAVREATNGQDFIRRVYDKTGLSFTIVSGLEEARLIYLGVSSGLPHSDRLRLFIDIGGGSTELIVGDSQRHQNLDSLKVGCVRLTDLFFGDGRQPVSSYSYAALQRYIRNEALHSFQRLAAFDIAEAVASSGTAQNLAEIAAALEDADAAREGRLSRAARQTLTYRSLRRVVGELCRRTADERKLLPGINPNRADVLVAGAAILQTVMEEQGFESVLVSNRNLQNGILVDYLRRAFPDSVRPMLPTREESVLQLARFCRFEEEHARHVARLALELFDSARAAGLHEADAVSRELLYYAALLHDIGIFISFSKHNAHSHYLIRNTELLGFTEREIEIMAAVAYFHRKRPSRKYPLFLELESGIREEVRLLSTFLTFAERMDKSHCQLVREVWFERGEEGLELHLRSIEDCPIERGEVERSRKLLKKLFKEGCFLCFHLEKEGKVLYA